MQVYLQPKANSSALFIIFVGLFADIDLRSHFLEINEYYVSINNFFSKTFLTHCFISIPPENQRFFWHFQEL